MQSAVREDTSGERQQDIVSAWKRLHVRMIMLPFSLLETSGALITIVVKMLLGKDLFNAISLLLQSESKKHIWS